MLYVYACVSQINLNLKLHRKRICNAWNSAIVIRTSAWCKLRSFAWHSNFIDWHAASGDTTTSFNIYSMQHAKSSDTAEIARVVPHKPVPKTGLPGLQFCRWQYGSSISEFDAVWCLLCEIRRNDDHWAVQGHSRSPILVKIESPYATSH